MLRKLSLTSALVMLFIGLMSQAVMAYSPTDTKAQKLGDDMAIYALMYTMGNGLRDTYLPMQIVRSGTEAEQAVVYRLDEDKLGDLGTGLSVAGILTDAQVVDGEYFIPAGKRATFIIFVLLQTSKDTLEADYTLELERFPWHETIPGETIKQAFTPGEIAYFKTAEVELNSDNPSKN